MSKGQLSEHSFNLCSAFCPSCGTRIYHAPERNPEIFNVKPGTLDNTKWFMPVTHLWVTSAQPWVQIPNDAILYPQQPETFEPILQAWQTLLGKPSQRRFCD
ncbi:GFA family protein [Acaryochloris sp. CCMEE 5410]|uniref:GFA family protein n=1 Tax=Acaryochloris sp. CCMEE 5410 TaxID=310037 RepID=UPI0008FF9758|nr:GFA family protein [Acaryochloris sp. CCMEE 5410]KAI9135399.1 GFA family protein [Acaryochloris sp. CCMEE 5410]